MPSYELFMSTERKWSWSYQGRIIVIGSRKTMTLYFYFLLGASARLHLWFIVQYHWEIVPVHVKCQKHSFPSITSYQSSVQVICIRVTAALWVFGFVTSWCLYNSLWRVESSIFVPVTDPHTSLVKLYWLYDGSDDVFSLLLYILLPLERSQGTGCS